jgi:peptidoglycan/LPS O-acetylase OafA/YrhL
MRCRLSRPLELKERDSFYHIMISNYRPFGFFRFMLASMVVISHTHILAGEGISGLLAPYGLGNMAVMSFFVLSGFIIAEASFTYYSGRLGAFLKNRLLRIFPPFFVALVFSIALHWSIAQYLELQFFDDIAYSEEIFSWKNIFGNSLYLIVILGLGKLGLAPDYLFVRYAWAVAVELMFYYIFAMAIFFSNLPMVINVLTRKGYWLLISIALTLFFIGAILSAREVFFHFGVWVPYFILGISIFFLLKNGASSRPLWLSILGLSLAGVNWHAYVYISTNPSSNVAAALLILNFLIAILWILGHLRVSEKWKRIDRRLGDVAYPLYLNHYAVSIAILSLLGEELRNPLLFVMAYSACLLVSYGAFFVSEPLTRDIRNRIRGTAL